MTDSGGHSAFWEALGRKFFQMDFLEAERIVEGARNRTLIVELMPHYPIYVPLLPGDAQAAMGQVHPEGELPFHVLSEEGFEPDEFIDIFDGGPILQAHRHGLRSFAASMQREVTSRTNSVDASTAKYLVSNGREHGFRTVIAECPPVELSESIVLPPEAMRCLDVVSGDALTCVKL
jgi:arginine N-succinyltransferase